MSPTMSNRDVYLTIQKAIEKPRFKALYDELERERADTAAEAERAELGQELYGAIEKWRKLCDPNRHYAVVFRQGKTIKWDVLEFEEVSSDDSRVASIRVQVLAPKRRKERDTGEYLEWEKEIKLKPENILEVQALPKPVDMYDVATYEKLLGVCARWAEKFD
ncbi:MAG: hypothetical protein KDI34_12470 [Halioglobus sp.]|nr:hypothetical protein [Halioglobus sp.]